MIKARKWTPGCRGLQQKLQQPFLKSKSQLPRLSTRLDLKAMAGADSLCIELQEAGPPPVQLVFEKVTIEATPPHGPFSKARPVKRILDEVSGIFGPAECIACMGPSGSGKTTMLNALTGVTRPTSGTISANGQPVDAATMRRYSALVPQDDLLTPTLTVYESLMEAALFKSGLGVVARQDRVEKLLEQFGLSGCRDVRIGHPDGKKGISGGQRRRLSVALELCGTVSLLYLDEPTSGLDAVSNMALVRLLSSLARGTPPPVGPRTVGPPPAPAGPPPASLGPPTLPPLRPHPSPPRPQPCPLRRRHGHRDHPPAFCRGLLQL